MAQGTFAKPGIEAVDYTPAAAVVSGQVIVQSSLVGIAKQPIAAGVLGSLAIAGVFDVDQKAEIIVAGKPVYWDADGDSVSGTAGAGAVTATVADGVFMGFALQLTAATDSTVRVALQSAPVDAIA
jgi:predicted RecA/RadA family phage recombinase